MSSLISLLVLLCAIGFCAVCWRKSSILRVLAISLFLAGSGALWAPTAAAQDAVYFRFPVCPADTLLVIDAGELTDPYTRSTVYGDLVFSHFVELVYVGGGIDNAGGPQVRQYVDVSYENPLRTLRRGNRIERTGTCSGDNGLYVFSTIVISGP